MPEYEYRCPAGHVSRIWTPMTDRPDKIPCQACDLEAERRLSMPQRPIVKGGTPNYHGKV